MLRKFLSAFIVTSLLAIAVACSSGDSFEIKCNIRGLDTGRVEMVYFDGHINAVTAHATDSRVTLTGSAKVPALVEVWDSDGQLLFTVIAADGDRLKVDMDLDDPLAATVKGNEASELLAQFKSDNAAELAHAPSVATNPLVERFILANPSSQAATVALMTLYDLNADPVKADSLLNRLDASARNLSSIRDFSRTLAVASASVAYDVMRPITFRVSTDTIVEFIPYRHSGSLLYVSTQATDTATSRLLRALRKDFTDKRLGLVETSLIPDSARWRSVIKGDSATWKQTWLPGGLGNPSLINLAIPSTPYYIAVDSTGRQLYRGSSVEKADSALRSLLK